MRKDLRVAFSGLMGHVVLLENLLKTPCPACQNLHIDPTLFPAVKPDQVYNVINQVRAELNTLELQLRQAEQEDKLL